MKVITVAQRDKSRLVPAKLNLTSCGASYNRSVLFFCLCCIYKTPLTRNVRSLLKGGFSSVTYLQCYRRDEV